MSDSPYIQNLRDEHAALRLKITLLRDLASSPMYNDFPEAERSRITRQLEFMDGYAAVLAERINNRAGLPEEE